jgi:hypothetical protein
MAPRPKLHFVAKAHEPPQARVQLARLRLRQRPHGNLPYQERVAGEQLAAVGQQANTVGGVAGAMNDPDADAADVKFRAVVERLIHAGDASERREPGAGRSLELRRAADVIPVAMRGQDVFQTSVQFRQTADDSVRVKAHVDRRRFASLRVVHDVGEVVPPADRDLLKHHAAPGHARTPGLVASAAILRQCSVPHTSKLFTASVVGKIESSDILSYYGAVRDGDAPLFVFHGVITKTVREHTTEFSR